MFAKLRRGYYTLKHNYLNRANIFVVVILVVFGILAISSVSSMSRNWQQQKQVEARQIELARLAAEVATLEYEKAYHQTREYQELLAREKQNKKLPGETMLLLPPNSDSAKQKYAETDDGEEAPPPNIIQWLNFFFN